MPRLIDVVEWPTTGSQDIVHREPEGGPGDFRLGSQVIVREAQNAVFFRDGKALDVLGPGRHTIQTGNIPILAGLIGLATSGKTPFPAEVVFVNMKQFTDQKWGTPEPIVFRDSEFGMARLRSFGTYAFQVKDPQLFVNKIVGQQGVYETSDVEDYLRSIIVEKFTDTLGEVKKPLLDLPAHYNEISAATKANLADDFAALGLTLMQLYVNAITPTDETAKAIDERAAMGAIGDMDKYMKFKAARALGDAANNPAGGAAGTGVGLGAGIGLGAGLAGMVSQSFQQAQQAQPQQSAAPAASGALTKQQVQEAMDALDMRFSKGEINEDMYNRMMTKWQEKMKELGG